MTFARHLAAALLAVAVVVALGVAWEHSSAARMIAPPAGVGPGGPAPEFRRIEKAPPGQGSQGNVQVIRVAQPENGGLNLSDLQNLTRTAEIEAAIIAVVVALSLVRRSRRRARARARERTAGQTAGPIAAAGPPPGPEPAD